MAHPSGIRLPATVRRLLVKDLFGHYTYDLKAVDETAQTHKILLLYGDNGSGKTTLLKLLFHTLSPSPARGHRTFLAETPFRQLLVEFDNGAAISVTRTTDGLVGPYRILGRGPTGAQLEVDVSVASNGKVRSSDVDDTALTRLLRLLSDPPLVAYLLTDDRSLISDAFETQPSRRRATTDRFINPHFADDDWTLVRSNADDNSGNASLLESIERFKAWVSRQVISARKAGDADIAGVYLDVVRRIAQSGVSHTEKSQEGAQRVSDWLIDLVNKSAGFVSLGLVEPISVNGFLEVLHSAHESRRGAIAAALEPFVESTNAKLKALSELERQLTIFSGIVNSFFRSKSVHVTVEGLLFLDRHGVLLDPEVLSSGEQQLLLMLCNVLSSTNHPSLFIIDEPELSLNVKWQRELVDSLLHLVEGSHVQFIMATHSIELLTRHKKSLMRLDAREVR